MSRLREDRKTAAAVGRLEAAGVTVIERPYGRGAAVPLQELVDSDGAVLDNEAHASCPGHAAVVHEARPDDVSYYCVDPAAHGHKDRWQRSAPTVVGGKMTDEAKAERREVIENLSKHGAPPSPSGGPTSATCSPAKPPRRVWLRRHVSRLVMSHLGRHLHDVARADVSET